MTTQMQGEEGARLKRNSAEQAIKLALESKWEEAVTLNQAILASFPADVDSWNRLGKALLELGRFREARESYSKSIGIDPVNTIAKRNLDRLAQVTEDDEQRREVARVAQDLFIEEMGKSGSTVLTNVGVDVIARTVSGDEVYLKPSESILTVENAQGELIGTVEPKLGLRLLRLMNGGNRYASAVKSVGQNQLELIIKEIYRDPTQTRVSFPAIAEGVRPYTRESLLRYDIDDDDDDEVEGETENEDWEGDGETTDSPVSLSSIKETMDIDEEDEE